MPVVNPQPSSPSNTPEAGTVAPVSYIAAADAVTLLQSRYSYMPGVAGLTSTSFAEGLMLSCSQELDLCAPFMGVKTSPLQERLFPRTFRIAHTVSLGLDAFMYGLSSAGGVNLLNYDNVIPQQVIDWVCLEALRKITLPFDRNTSRESVDGVSVTYAEGSMLEETQFSLIRPFLNMQGAQSAYPGIGQ